MLCVNILQKYDFIKLFKSRVREYKYSIPLPYSIYLCMATKSAYKMCQYTCTLLHMHKILINTIYKQFSKWGVQAPGGSRPITWVSPKTFFYKW